MRLNCLVLMISGSEVRQFGHSGMISRLLDKGHNVIVAARIVDQDLADQLDPRVEIIPLINEPISPKFHRIQMILDRIFDMKESRSGKIKWVDEWKKPTASINGRINNVFIAFLAYIGYRIPIIYKKLMQIESTLEMQENSPKWTEILHEKDVNAVILSTPRSEVLHPILIEAKKLEIPRFLFYHSIKDISGKGRINHSFTSIGVWNKWMENELLFRNPFVLSRSSIHITGCAHFDCVGKEDSYIPEDQFRGLIGANATSRLILYPAAVHWVLPDQGRYIRMIVNAIEKGKLPDDLQIVVRTNPMDVTDYFSTKFKDCPYVIIQKSDWRMEEKVAWNFQRRPDSIIYNSLLHYAVLCFGIPSTVTVECAVSTVPVINIGFDLSDPKPPRSMKTFWNAEFYQEEVRHKMAELCENEDDLIDQIKICLEKGKQKSKAEYDAYFSEFLGVLPHHSVAKYVELIEGTLSTASSRVEGE